jgi:hypothetical protein
MMPEFSDVDAGNLKASRVVGSVRQLFCVNPDDVTPEDRDFLLRPSETRYQAGLAMKIEEFNVPRCACDCEVQRVDMQLTSSADFKRDFLSNPSLAQPALISQSTLDFEWPAGLEHWSPIALCEGDVLGCEKRLEVAQTDATVSLGEYVAYMNSTGAAGDDNPVYVFETLVEGEHDAIISKFVVPRLFTDLSADLAGCHTPGDTADLLSAAGEDGLLFGTHRWLIMGPARSGSNLHVDPLGTSAWNTLLVGSKLWALFPPTTNKADLQPPVGITTTAPVVRLEEGGTSPASAEMDIPESAGAFCAADWFANVFPRLPACTLATCVQFTQEAGETVFVPAGWHHAVLNLEQTVCVTQNFASPSNYTEVARCLYESSGSDDLYLVDAWREEVLVQWPQLERESRMFCVHCGALSAGNICELLCDRPVCVACVRSLPLLYEEVTGAQAEELYGLRLWALDEDDTPPHVVKRDPITKKKCKYYLHAHVRDCLE